MSATLVSVPTRSSAPAPSLRTHSPVRVLEGFGRAVAAACRVAVPRTVEELQELISRARAEGLTVGFRGAGQSYGDAAIHAGGLVIDTSQLDRVLDWNPAEGIIDAEPGVTIEGLWRRTIEDGYWPTVVPGTMRPTLAGCVGANIHGKNNFKVGTFGEHVLDLDLILADGSRVKCSRTENPELFHAVFGGIGLLGAVARVRLKLKRVESGRLRVTALTARNLDEMFDLFTANLADRDYLVGWVDCLAGGASVGRGEVHAANYLHAGEDPEGRATLHVERQGLPPRILGVPKTNLWRGMQLFMNDPGVRLTNTAKYLVSRAGHGKTYLQSHVAFAFLLDYVPNWRMAYGAGGFIQYQIFIPDAAKEKLKEVLALCQREGHPSYLGVLKRHRPDPFMISHALDGWSLAMDFKVTASGRAGLWSMLERVTDLVVDAGGRFYFAKDAVVSQPHMQRAYGKERLEKFVAVKKKVDPAGMFANDLWLRALAPR
jgi:FAD/FMN-containing dehydrogenase